MSDVLLDMVRRLTALERAQSRQSELPAWPLSVSRGGTGVSAPPVFLAHKNGVDQVGVAGGVFTKLTFGTADINVGSYFDTSTSRFTPPAGYYQFSFNIGWSTSAANQQYYAFIYKNGVRHRDNMFGSATTVGLVNVGGALISANGTDYFEVYVFHSEGGINRTIVGATTFTYIFGSFLRGL